MTRSLCTQRLYLTVLYLNWAILRQILRVGCSCPWKSAAESSPLLQFHCLKQCDAYFNQLNWNFTALTIFFRVLERLGKPSALWEWKWFWPCCYKTEMSLVSAWCPWLLGQWLCSNADGEGHKEQPFLTAQSMDCTALIPENSNKNA